MTLPAFSVVVTTYNRPAQLERCLAALARSSYARDAFEVIVVNDGGSVPLGAIVAGFRDRMNVTLVDQPNAGPAGGRNYGARVARNEFLAFTDDDCEPDPGWLAALGRCLQHSPDSLVGGHTVNGLPDNPYSRASQLIVEMAYAFYNSDLQHPRFLTTNNLAARAELFWQCGGFDRQFRTSEDREFCDRWRNRRLAMAYLPEALVVHRHPLTLASFCRQHFQYGRGAARFHRTCAARHSSRLRDHVGFHLRLPRWWRSAAAAGDGGVTLPHFLPYLVLWQLANACGYFYETLLS